MPTGKGYPEGFDESCGLPAWAMRKANSLACSMTGDRNFDVVMLASALISRATPSCRYCHDTGDVHDSDGLYVGKCTACNRPIAPRVVTDADVERAKRVYCESAKRDDCVFPVLIAGLRDVIQADRESFAQSLPAARVPDGFVLVPIEPTAAMLTATIQASMEAESVYDEPRPPQAWEKFGQRRNRIAHVYKAMLAAAPQAGEMG